MKGKEKIFKDFEMRTHHTIYVYIPKFRDFDSIVAFLQGSDDESNLAILAEGKYNILVRREIMTAQLKAEGEKAFGTLKSAVKLLKKIDKEAGTFNGNIYFYN